MRVDHQTSSMNTPTAQQRSWFSRQASHFDDSRFGLMTTLMTAQSCYGSIAAMLTLQANNIAVLAVCAAVTLMSNSAFIAQSSAKVCLALFYTSIAVNTGIIVVYLYLRTLV